MASALFSYLGHFWPFSLGKQDELKLSSQLVNRLSIPEQTKQFVFAFEQPDSGSVVYILAGQSLSELSAFDVDCLIREVKPKAVIAYVAPSALIEIQFEEKKADQNKATDVPTSAFMVLKRCFLLRFNKHRYETLAGTHVLKEIFGVGFYDHLFTAKKAAEEIGSDFFLLESPKVSACSYSPSNATDVNEGLGLLLHTSCLIPTEATALSLSSKRLCLTDAFQEKMLKTLVPSLELQFMRMSEPSSTPHSAPNEHQSQLDYETPSFAKSIYPLLADLHSIFIDIPAIGKALLSAQKILVCVNEGEPVESRHVSEVHNFRIAIEALRIALNNAARCPVNKRDSGGKQMKMDFSELSSEDKCQALSAQILKKQARELGGSVVVIVDASSVSGLRMHWNTVVPQEFVDLGNECFIHRLTDDFSCEEGTTDQKAERKMLLADKPVVAVGAGATAVLGAASLSKALPTSTIVKFATYKVPLSLKFIIVQFKRSAATGLSKMLPGIATTGTKTTSLNWAISSEKIRALTHGLMFSAEKTSLLAMRTSFYEIMRRRHVRPVRFAPLATFGCSLAACAALLVYRDGIECAVDSIPSIPTITSLGRGLQSLHQSSQEVRASSRARIQETLQSFMHNIKKLKVQ